MITPLGKNAAENARSFRDGRSAFRPVTLFDVSKQRVKTAGQIELPELSDLPWRARRRMDRGSLLACHAAREALAHAGISRDPAMPLFVGTSAAAMPLGEDYYRAAITGNPDRGAQLHRVETYQAQRQMTELARLLGIGGQIRVISNACASGANAIGHAFHLVRSGRAEKVLAGGYDALCQLVFAGFDALQALAISGIPRPFDALRDGLALGEGAAFLVVESAESAAARGARVIAEISGYAAATDIHHLTQPHPEGDAALATMTAACEMAGLAPENIGYINSHGTGTPLNDIAEARAIARWAGLQVGNIRVSSTKSAIGHLLGAAGAVESAICLLALEHRFLPASLNIREVDAACAFELVRTPRDADLEHVLTNSFGFGGANATLVFSDPAATAGREKTRNSALMPETFAITSTGAVSSAGWGVTALLDALEHGRKSEISELIRECGAEKIVTPVMRVPIGKPGALPARLRRASPISRFAAAATLEALGEERIGKIRDGNLRCGVIFTVTNGCVNYSNRFFAEVLADPALASPILFPETVFNAPSSHLSAMIGSSAPNDTLISDGAGFLAAIDQAMEWISRGDVDCCVVVTAEEIDWLSAEALRLYPANFIPSEGAAAVVIERASGAGALISHAPEIIPYTGKTRARAAAELDSRFHVPGTSWFREFPGAPGKIPACDELSRFIGETMGASAGFLTIAAVESIRRGRTRKSAACAIGSNQQAAALILRAPQTARPELLKSSIP